MGIELRYSENLQCLILSCNPKPESLTVHAAEKAQGYLLEHAIESFHVHLDKIQFDPTYTREDILRRSSFDTQVVTFQKILSRIDCMCVYFPDWWGFPPSLLLAWLQKVFAPGVAFTYVGDDYMPKEMQPLLRGLKVFFAITTDEIDTHALDTTISILQHKLFHYSGVELIGTSILSHTRERAPHEIHAWIQYNAEYILKLLTR